MKDIHGSVRALMLGALVAGLLLARLPGVWALDPALDVYQYAHTAWKARDGLFKGSIFSIAQTPDAYLWLGTEFGLLRFDGVRAVPWEPPPGHRLPSNLIENLLVARDGTLWIGTLDGLASWKDGNFRQYPEAAGDVLTLLEDHDGTIWFGLSEPGRLCAIRREKVQCRGAGSFGAYVLALYEDRLGNLWVSSETGLWRWKPGPTEHYAIPRGILAHSLIEGDDGTLLLATAEDGLKQLVGGKIQSYPLVGVTGPFRIDHLFRSHDGSLWIGGPQGLLHLHECKTDTFGPDDGLSGDGVTSFFEDREGSVWVSTKDGLDRFREYAIPTISRKQGLSNSDAGSVQATPDGSIWIGMHNGLNRWNDARVTVYATGYGKRSAADIGGARRDQQRNVIGSVTEIANSGLTGTVVRLGFDDHGQLWVCTTEGVFYFKNSRFVRLPGISTGPAGEFIWAIMGDGHGKVWMSHEDLGLIHLKPGDAVQPIPWSQLGHKGQAAKALLPDRLQGGVWLGFYEGGLVYLEHDQVRASYTVADGLGKGSVNDLQRSSDGSLWAATDGGLSQVKGGRVTTLTSKNGLPCNEVHWLREDNDSLWLYMSCGLVRIARSEWDAWARNPQRIVEATIYDSSDGVTIIGRSRFYGPHVSKAPDGRIWFVHRNGVSIIDPHHLPFNRLAPPVYVERLTTDGQTFDAVSHLRLPARIRDLEIEYTALSLVAPEKVLFRYKLDGRDSDWQNVVSRRQAFYSDLRPGHYRFRVTACNNSGVWNEEGASLAFTIAPAWYQTSLFRISCLLAALFLLWLFYYLRMKEASHAIRARFDERIAERTRLARDLHDTLLQTLQGSKLVADDALEHRSDADYTSRSLEKLSAWIDRAIREGRAALNALNTSAFDNRELSARLQSALDDRELNGVAEGFLTVSGTPAEMDPLITDEICRVGYEAIRNTFMHSCATRIEVQLAYSEDFTLIVRDNGRGMDSTTASRGRDGHFGLRSMRERAARIHGQFQLITAPNLGTTIELKIGGKTAFGRDTSVWSKLLHWMRGTRRPEV